eukprot:2972959-Amphidinium_carterae.3
MLQGIMHVDGAPAAVLSQLLHETGNATGIIDSRVLRVAARFGLFKSWALSPKYGANQRGERRANIPAQPMDC